MDDYMMDEELEGYDLSDGQEDFRVGDLVKVIGAEIYGTIIDVSSSGIIKVVFDDGDTEEVWWQDITKEF